MNAAHAPPAQDGPWAIALAGLLSLAVAMGIGRFAFTPLLPMMLHDGVIDLATATWLASANYLGYLGGAVLCIAQPWLWARLPVLPPVRPGSVVRIGLLCTALLTVAMAVPLPGAWPALRCAAGVTSAVVLIHTSGWCLSRLAERGASALGGAVFAGPGAGIVVSGLCAGALVAWHWRAATAWLFFGMLGLALTAVVWPLFSQRALSPQRAATPGAVAPAGRIGAKLEITVLAAAYGLAGFGYIVTATFLPVIARTAVPDSPWLDLFWPIFGAGVVCGALLSTRLHVHGDLRWLLALAYVIQAAGIALGVVEPKGTGFAVGSLLLGLPFTAITFFTMQEVRRLRPRQPSAYMGLLTATYGIGQILGPPLVALLLRHSASVGVGFERSLIVAISALLLGATMHAAAALACRVRWR